MTAPEPRDSVTHPTTPTPTRSAVLGAAEGQETAAGDEGEMGRILSGEKPPCDCGDQPSEQCPSYLWFMAQRHRDDLPLPAVRLCYACGRPLTPVDGYEHDWCREAPNV